MRRRGNPDSLQVNKIAASFLRLIQQ